MQHNEPGREPTEPTDAELLIDFARKQDRGTINDWVYARAACATRGYEYLSGHRPMPGSEVSRAEVLRMSTETLLKAEAERMPDTPAPDEVAQLRAEVERLKGWLAETESDNESWVLRDTALSARVAELEAELAALRNGGQPVGPRPFILTPDGKERKYWAGTKDPGATFLGKEPTSE